MLLTGTPISNSTMDLLTIVVVALKEVVANPRGLLDGLHNMQPDVRLTSAYHFQLKPFAFSFYTLENCICFLSFNSAQRQQLCLL